MRILFCQTIGGLDVALGERGKVVDAPENGYQGVHSSFENSQVHAWGLKLTWDLLARNPKRSSVSHLLLHLGSPDGTGGQVEELPSAM